MLHCSHLKLLGATFLLVCNPLYAFTQVEIDTSMGTFQLMLNENKAPETVANFLSYVDEGFYNGLIFHRVEEYFVIQSGAYNGKMEYQQPKEPVVNESDNGLKNLRGTIAMARGDDPDSANAQFFINIEDNPGLDATPDKPGYTVFGQVVLGLSVADAISEVEVEDTDRLNNVPVEPVVINSITRK